MSTLLSQNVLSEIGTSLVFGLGYYFYNTISKKFYNKKIINEDQSHSANNSPIIKGQNAKNSNQNSFGDTGDSDSEGEVKDFLEEDSPNDKNYSEKLTLEKNLKLKNVLKSELEQYSYAKTLEEGKSIIEKECKDLLTKAAFDSSIVLNELQKRGVAPTINIYNYLLYHSYLTKGNTDNETADEILEEIMDVTGPVEPNVYTLNIIIKGLCLKYKNKPKEFDQELINYFGEFQSRGIKAEVSSYNAILESLVEMKRFDDSWKQFTNMQKETEPECFTVELISKAITNKLNLDQDKLWIKRGYEINNNYSKQYPNAFKTEFYEALINASLKNEKNTSERKDPHISAAFDLFEDKMDSVKFNVNFLKNMMDIYIRRYDTEKIKNIYDLFKKIEDNDLIHEIQIKIIKYCIVCGDTEFGLKIFKESNQDEEMQLLKIKIKKNDFKMQEILDFYLEDDLYQQCSLQLISELLDCTIEIKDRSTFEDLVDYINTQIEEQRFILSPLEYSLIIKGYLLFDNQDELIAMLDKAVSEKIFIDKMLFDSISQYLITVNEAEKLRTLRDEMSSYGLNYPLGKAASLKILDIYIEEKIPTKAYDLFLDLLVNKKIKIEEEVLLKLIKLQLENQYFDRILTLFNSYLKEKLIPNFTIFDLVIHMCLKIGYLKEAISLSITALQHFVSIDSSILIIIPQLLMAENSEFKVYEKAEIASKILDLMNHDQSEYRFNSQMKGIYIGLLESLQSSPKPYRKNVYYNSKKEPQSSKAKGKIKFSINSNSESIYQTPPPSSSEEEISVYDTAYTQKVNMPPKTNNHKGHGGKFRQKENMNRSNRYGFNNGNHFRQEEEVSIYS
ncbi:MAG: pentatricopeptide repeat-containing protein [archaeon]|nr:pentatricopeptide repeat-containing protein [archaeon]